MLRDCPFQFVVFLARDKTNSLQRSEVFLGFAKIPDYQVCFTQMFVCGSVSGIERQLRRRARAIGSGSTRSKPRAETLEGAMTAAVHALASKAMACILACVLMPHLLLSSRRFGSVFEPEFTLVLKWIAPSRYCFFPIWRETSAVGGAAWFGGSTVGSSGMRVNARRIPDAPGLLRSSSIRAG